MFNHNMVYLKMVVVTQSVDDWAGSQRVSSSSPGCEPKLERVGRSAKTP